MKDKAPVSTELKAELDAAADYFERTGKNLWSRSLVEQRKIIEQYREDHATTN
jgi:hypothetical protein